MPKIKQLPTPAQARALQALLDYEDRGLRLAYFPRDRRSYARWSANRSMTEYEVENIFGKVRASTAKKLVQEGWIQAENEKLYYSFMLSETGREIATTLVPEQLQKPSKIMSTGDIIEALRKRHPFPTWIFAQELRLGTGWGGITIPGHYRRINYAQAVDVFVMHTWPSRKFLRISYEVKASRSDFLKELENPDKRLGGLFISNEFYFAAPEGMIKEEEIPEECGLIEIHTDLKTKMIVKAPWRESCDPYWPLIASIGRSISR